MKDPQQVLMDEGIESAQWAVISLEGWDTDIRQCVDANITRLMLEGKVPVKILIVPYKLRRLEG